MTTNGRTDYSDLPRYAEIRSNQLSPLLAPYIEVTDRYGEILCRIC
jgi:hypothetical protein